MAGNRKQSSSQLDKMSKKELINELKSIRNCTDTEPSRNTESSASSRRDVSDDDILTIGAFRTILREELNERLTLINELEKKVTVLQKTVLQQQECMERIEANRRDNNLIISGYLETKPDRLEDIKEILSTIAGQEIIPKRVQRLGTSLNRTTPRQLLVVLADVEKRNAVLVKAKTLKDNIDFKGVYLNADEPPMTRKENARLRKKAYDYRKLHPNSKIYIKKGKLYMNEDVIDNFNLQNQLQPEIAD
jgi:hypothetical protein